MAKQKQLKVIEGTRQEDIRPDSIERAIIWLREKAKTTIKLGKHWDTIVIDVIVEMEDGSVSGPDGDAERKDGRKFEWPLPHDVPFSEYKKRDREAALVKAACAAYDWKANREDGEDV